MTRTQPDPPNGGNDTPDADWNTYVWILSELSQRASPSNLFLTLVTPNRASFYFNTFMLSSIPENSASVASHEETHSTPLL